MKLSYNDSPIEVIFRKRINATITTDHPLSSYGMPVILLEDGDPIDLTTWVICNYSVEEATPVESELLGKWLSQIANIRGEQQRRAASVRTTKKAASSRENGKKGGRPKEHKDIIYLPKCSLNHDEFKTYYQYQKMFREYSAHYQYKVKVEGGWMFFEFLTDYETWLKQK